MSSAYIDTSAITAVVLRDIGWESMADRIAGFTQIVSSNLLEAEMRSALAREGREFTLGLVERIVWIYPDRPLSAEMATVLDAGYLRGADLFHVATALYITGQRYTSQLVFITLDRRQRAVAAALGFRT